MCSSCPGSELLEADPGDVRVTHDNAASGQIVERPKPFAVQMRLRDQCSAVAAHPAGGPDDLGQLPPVKDLQEVLAGVSLRFLQIHPLAPVGAEGMLTAAVLDDSRIHARGLRGAVVRRYLQ